MGFSIRDLFVTLGFDIDDAPLKRLDKSINNVKKSAKGLAIIGVAFGGLSAIFLKQAGDIEQVEIAFETMIGSAEKAKDLMVDITEFAAKTPFQLTGLIQSSKQLLAFGIASEDIIDTMRTLGDIAAGVGKDKLPNIVLAFGKIRTKGKATMEELNILLEAGVPVLDALASKFGVTTQELFKMVTAGKVGFEDVNEALVNLTTGTGKFAGLMDKQSKSFLGIVSNIIDIMEQLAASIGKKLLPEAKAFAKQLLAVFEANQKIIKTKMIAFMKSGFKILRSLFKILISIIKAIVALAEVFGGLENAVNGVFFAILAFAGLNVLAGIGSMILLVLSLAKAFVTVRTAILLAQAAAFAIPILIGAAVIALGLIIEDIISFFKGKDSITGLIVEAFKVDPAELEEGSLKTFLLTIKEIMDDISVGLDVIARGGGVLASIYDAVFGTGNFNAGNLATAPINTNTTSTRVNAPITVQVPPGTPPELVADATQAGVREAMGDILRETSRATEPSVEF